jgi:hypothetical protein
MITETMRESDKLTWDVIPFTGISISFREVMLHSIRSIFLESEIFIPPFFLIFSLYCAI